MSIQAKEPLEVETGDHRILAVAISGDDAGWPVFLLHGTPGARTGPKPRNSVLYRLGVRLICYDRPGYGRSTRRAARCVADAALDVAAIAAELKIEHFSVAGRSGGGPHALACAALLPTQVKKTAVMVSVAPSDAHGLDWFDGMTSANQGAYTTVDTDAVTMAQQFTVRARRAAANPLSLLDVLRRDMTESDRQVVMDVTIQRLLADAYFEGLRDGPYGWIDDITALRANWGFDLGSITGPVRLWHGVNDNFAPAAHTRWLASQIPGAEMQLQADTAHFGAVEILPSILSWLAS